MLGSRVAANKVRAVLKVVPERCLSKTTKKGKWVGRKSEIKIGEERKSGRRGTEQEAYREIHTASQ